MTGFLRKNERGRWEIFEPFGQTLELTSGLCFELAVKGKWVPVRMEHNATDYYAFSVHYCEEGSPVLEDGMTARTID